MSRVDVVSAEKDKFKVLVNFIQCGITLNSETLANKEAQKIHSQLRNSELHLCNA